MNPSKSSPKESKTSEAMENYRQRPMKPLSIYDFTRADDVADVRSVGFGSTKGGWRLSDDEVIGGFSRGNIQLIDRENQTEDEQLQKQRRQPFIRWTGNIDTRIGPKSRAKRSGFCALRCPEFPFGVPLSNYNALELKCKSDGRVYTVNLKVSSYFPDDLYQALITVEKQKGNDFLTVVLPFSDFTLTSSGVIRETQRYLDGGIHLENLGLTIMDDNDGPFQFDLARIRAVNYVDGVIVGDDSS